MCGGPVNDCAGTVPSRLSGWDPAGRRWGIHIAYALHLPHCHIFPTQWMTCIAADAGTRRSSLPVHSPRQLLTANASCLNYHWPNPTELLWGQNVLPCVAADRFKCVPPGCCPRIVSPWLCPLTGLACPGGSAQLSLSSAHSCSGSWEGARPACLFSRQDWTKNGDTCIFLKWELTSHHRMILLESLRLFGSSVIENRMFELFQKDWSSQTTFMLKLKKKCFV